MKVSERKSEKIMEKNSKNAKNIFDSPIYHAYREHLEEEKTSPLLTEGFLKGSKN